MTVVNMHEAKTQLSKLVARAEAGRELAFTARHGREAGRLPPHHRDPFGRALVARARVEGLVLVAADPAATPARWPRWSPCCGAAGGGAHPYR